jgi:dipeptidyl aminopeptidase/acylaminoacyl peptidase
MNRHASWLALIAIAALPAAARPADDAVGELAPNDNLVVEGIPKLPSTLADDLGRYTEFRAAVFLSWHPTRREMLIATRFGDTAQVHEVRMPGGARRQLTFFPDRVGGAAWPRHSGSYFVFAQDRGGDEFAQLYRLDRASGAVTRISDGGRSQNGIGPFSHRGELMAYASTRRNGADRDVYVIDPLHPETDRRVAVVKGGGWEVLDWSPDDKSLLLLEGISINESHLWIVDVATGERKRVTSGAGAETVAYSQACFSRDGQALFVVTDRASEFQRLARLDLASGSHHYLTSDIPWDVSAFDLSPDGRTIVFVTNENGISVMHFLDTRSGRHRAGPKLPLGVASGPVWHANGRDVAFSLTTSRAPNDAYSVDAATLAVTRWTESEIGGLNALTFPEPSLLRWKSFDGREISGFLYKPGPRFPGRRPVIIDIHGGPESQERPGFIGWWNYYPVELGVALVFPNVRGSTGFGKSFTKLDNGERREDSVKDIGALLDWIAARPDLDPTLVMVTGGSYGGYMTLASATHFDARLRCTLSYVGISNFVTFLEHTEAYRRDLRRVEYGDERDPKMRELLLSISPLNNAKKITKPLFVVQGLNDPRVPASEAEQMVTTVKKNGGPVWYLLAKDEGHGFAKKRNRDFMSYAMIAFVRQYLLP